MDELSLHVGCGKGWIDSREAEIVPQFQRLNVTHSSSLMGQSATFSNTGEGTKGRQASPRSPTSPSRLTDYRRDGIDVRSVAKEFKYKTKTRGWSRSSVSPDRSSRPARVLQNVEPSAEKSTSEDNSQLLHSLNVHTQQDSGYFSFVRQTSKGDQSEFEALTLGPGCPWADSIALVSFV